MDTPQILEAHLQWLHPRSSSSSSRLSLTIPWVQCWWFHIAVSRPGFDHSDHKMKRVSGSTTPNRTSWLIHQKYFPQPTRSTPQSCRERPTPELRATVRGTQFDTVVARTKITLLWAQTLWMRRAIYGGWRSGAKLMCHVSCRYRVDNVRLQAFFQVDQQVDIRLYLMEATARHNITHGPSLEGKGVFLHTKKTQI